jgi:hypothetical protein
MRPVLIRENTGILRVSGRNYLGQCVTQLSFLRIFLLLLGINNKQETKLMGFSGTTMPLADRIKSLKEGLRAHVYNETGSNPNKVERTIVENDGQKVGEYVTVDGKVNEASSTLDAKKAGTSFGSEEANPECKIEEMNEDYEPNEKPEKVDLLKSAVLPKLISLRSKLTKR